MTTINQLSAIDQLQASDLVPVFSSSNGDARKASMSTIKEFIQDDFVPAGGVLAISGFYSMRKMPAVPAAIAVDVAYAKFANYDIPAPAFPAGRNSVAAMVTLGEFVMQRD